MRTTVDASNQFDRCAASMQLGGTDTEDVATIFVSRTVGAEGRFARAFKVFSNSNTYFSFLY